MFQIVKDGSAKTPANPTSLGRVGGGGLDRLSPSVVKKIF